MGIVELNRRLSLYLGIPAIRHCYVMAKSTGRQGNDLKRALPSMDEVVLDQVKMVLIIRKVVQTSKDKGMWPMSC
ncbi:hypothetical protein CsSME_00024836 [Camellia sinensis var. sinensis]